MFPAATVEVARESFERVITVFGRDIIPLSQLAVGLTLDVDIIMLDNMTPEQMREGVAMRAAAEKAGRIELEASGGITLDNVADVARTGVDRIAVGAITHSAESVDIGLDIHI